MTSFRKISDKLKCLVGYHSGPMFTENITGDTGITITICFQQCDRCGHSKINFIYGS